MLTARSHAKVMGLAVLCAFDAFALERTTVDTLFLVAHLDHLLYDLGLRVSDGLLYRGPKS